jgi:TonB family protein
MTALQINFAAAQNNPKDSSGGEKDVKWTAMSGKEFIFYMPEGYETISDGNYTKGKMGFGARVDRELKVARYINGVTLLMGFYEGDVKQIQKDFEEREKLSAVKDEEINGFRAKYFLGNVDKQYNKIQHFLVKNRLYILQAIGSTESNEIVKGFFESVRLITKNNTIAPNAPPDTVSTTLPKIIEKQLLREDDSKAVAADAVDRKLIILKAPRPRFSIEARRSLQSGRIKLKVLYSSSGKITDVEVLQSPSKSLTDAAVEAAKAIKFIPAEKDGKLVSIYKTQEYSFGTTASRF